MSLKNKKRLAALESHAESETDSQDALLVLVPLGVKRRVLEVMLHLEKLGTPINDETLKPWLSPDDWSVLTNVFGKKILDD